MKSMKIIQNTLALIAVLFGLVTIFVGSSVLMGSDPGYLVYLPLLIYNTAMGIMYVFAGSIIFRNITKGMYMAVGIFSLNLAVLITIYFLHTKSSSVADESLNAMVLRTVVWLVLFAILGSLSVRNKRYSDRPNS